MKSCWEFPFWEGMQQNWSFIFESPILRGNQGTIWKNGNSPEKNNTLFLLTYSTGEKTAILPSTSHLVPVHAAQSTPFHHRKSGNEDSALSLVENHSSWASCRLVGVHSKDPSASSKQLLSLLSFTKHNVVTAVDAIWAQIYEKIKLFLIK